MEEELNQLKSVFRSLVVSSPTQVDARSLLRDYRNMVGTQIPMSKFGYRDPIAFLRERFSDCFIGPTANPVLTLIVPDALKHVDKFVQKQKVSSTVKYKGKRRSVPESIVKPSPNLVASTFIPKQDSPKHELSCTYKRETTKQNYAPQPRVPNVSQVFQKKEKNIQNGESSIAPRGDTKIRTASLYNAYERQHARTNYDRDSIKEDDHSGRQTSLSSTSSSKRSQLEELRREIRELIVEHPDGVWCTDLLRLYRERHGRELNFFRFGYTSVLSLASAVDGVTASQHAARGDWLLADAHAAPAARRVLPRAPPRAPPPADPEDALPGIAFEADVFPADCMHLLESIPAASLAGVGKGDMLEVSVGEVYSPSHFWLLRLGERHNIAMEDMMDDMNRYYASAEGQARALSPGAVRVGHYCSSCYDGDWHRSLIVKILDSDTVKVRHVDYGTVDRVAVRGLRALRREWAALEAQALRARLAGARPPAAGRRWPRASAHHFLALIRNRQLVATVTAVDLQDDALEVLLIDTSTDDDLCITDEMIRSGHADPRLDSATGTSECYLFPRFEALESGDTPNFAEIYAYLRDGIALEFVDDFRRHVPPCLPPPEPDSCAAPPGSPPPLRDNRVPLFLETDTKEHTADAKDYSPPTPPPLPKPCARLAPRAARPRTPPTPPTYPQVVPQTYPQFASQSYIPYDYSLPLATSVSNLAFMPQTRPNYHYYVPQMQFTSASYSHMQPPSAPSPHMQPPSGPSPHMQPPSGPSPHMQSPPAPAPHVPPAAGPTREPVPGDVSLSASEVEAFALLSRVDMAAAHRFMLSALHRALGPPAAGPVQPPPGFGNKKSD